MGYKKNMELKRTCPVCKSILKIPVRKDLVDDSYRYIGRLKQGEKE